MADIFSKEKRSEVMSRIRSKNSKAERTVFSFLRRNRIYFQRHYKRAPGTPDIALPRKKIAVFIDGDFWHGRGLQELLDRLPAEYWRPKIERNMARDKEIEERLRLAGWKYLRVWESDIMRKRTQAEQLERVRAFLAAEKEIQVVGVSSEVGWEEA